MTGLRRAEQADEPEPDGSYDNPDYVPNPPYDPPVGHQAAADLIDPNTQEQP